MSEVPAPRDTIGFLERSYDSSPEPAEPARFALSGGRALTPRELVDVMLSGPPIAEELAHDFTRRFLPVGAR